MVVLTNEPHTDDLDPETTDHDEPKLEDHDLKTADHDDPEGEDHSDPEAEDHSDPEAEDHNDPEAEDHSDPDVEDGDGTAPRVRVWKSTGAVAIYSRSRVAMLAGGSALLLAGAGLGIGLLVAPDNG